MKSPSSSRSNSTTPLSNDSREILNSFGRKIKRRLNPKTNIKRSSSKSYSFVISNRNRSIKTPENACISIKTRTTKTPTCVSPMSRIPTQIISGYIIISIKTPISDQRIIRGIVWKRSFCCCKNIPNTCSMLSISRFILIIIYSIIKIPLSN